MNFHMFSQGARMCIALIAANIFTAVWLFQSVNVNVLSAITGVRESLVTAFKLACERSLSCMRANMYF